MNSGNFFSKNYATSVLINKRKIAYAKLKCQAGQMINLYIVSSAFPLIICLSNVAKQTTNSVVVLFENTVSKEVVSAFEEFSHVKLKIVPRTRPLYLVIIVFSVFVKFKIQSLFVGNIGQFLLRIFFKFLPAGNRYVLEDRLSTFELYNQGCSFYFNAQLHGVRRFIDRHFLRLKTPLKLQSILELSIKT